MSLLKLQTAKAKTPVSTGNPSTSSIAADCPCNVCLQTVIGIMLLVKPVLSSEDSTFDCMVWFPKAWCSWFLFKGDDLRLLSYRSDSRQWMRMCSCTVGTNELRIISDIIVILRALKIGEFCDDNLINSTFFLWVGLCVWHERRSQWKLCARCPEINRNCHSKIQLEQRWLICCANVDWVRW